MKVESLSYKGFKIDKKELEDFRNYIKSKYVNSTENILKKNIYIQDKSILQSKLREHFSIKRRVEDAEIVVIEDFLFVQGNFRTFCFWDHTLRKTVYDESKIEFSNTNRYKSADIVTPFFEEIMNLKENQKVIFVKDIYKYLYKYEVNLDFYNQCNNLLNSKNPLNTKLAMELMTNANWENDMVYLAELYNKYGQTSMRIDYRTSISFKGFETTYKPKLGLVATLNNSLRQPAAYIRYCTKPEHFDFVNSIYKQEFETALNGLFNSYNITVKNLEYNINYDVRQELK